MIILQFITITQSLLKAFRNSLTSLGVDEMMANQHQNYAKLIWSVVSKDKRNFQIHLISNLHLFTQPAITCSKLTIKRLEQGVKYVQS